MTTIHAYTGDQMTQDGPHKKVTNVVRVRRLKTSYLTQQVFAKAIGKVIPEIDGKLDGGAQRVPVATGSLTEVTVVLEKTLLLKTLTKQ